MHCSHIYLICCLFVHQPRLIHLSTEIWSQSHKTNAIRLNRVDKIGFDFKTKCKCKDPWTRCHSPDQVSYIDHRSVPGANGALSCLYISSEVLDGWSNSFRNPLHPHLSEVGIWGAVFKNSCNFLKLTIWHSFELLSPALFFHSLHSYLSLFIDTNIQTSSFLFCTNKKEECKLMAVSQIPQYSNKIVC